MTWSLPSSLKGSCRVPSVDVGSRGQHELAAEAARELERVLRAAVVDLERVDRLAVARDLECGEVHDRLEWAAERAERGGIGHVGLHESQALVVAELREVVEQAHREVVDADHLVPGSEHAADEIRAKEARTAGDEVRRGHGVPRVRAAGRRPAGAR